MIKATGLCKKFTKTEMTAEEGKKKKKLQKKKTEFYAVDHISLEADPGEIVGILGPNGAGKTTLLRILGCLMDATEGEVTLTDGKGRVITDRMEKKQKIGYLSGNTKMYGRLSSREILSIFGEVYGLSKEECKSRIEQIIEILDMSSFVDNRIEKLSTGQTQRAAIARCMIHQPEIYIFDEPTLGLDVLVSESILEFMKQEKEKKKTVLYSTHYMEEAQHLCDRVLMIDHGKIIASGTPEELMERYQVTNLRDVFFSLRKEQDMLQNAEKLL